MTPDIEQWEIAVADLWRRFDELERDDGVAAMQVLADRCPAADGRAAFELAGMYDSMGFETEAGAEYERALQLGLDEARHARLAVQYGSTLRVAIEAQIDALPRYQRSMRNYAAALTESVTSGHPAAD